MLRGVNKKIIEINNVEGGYFDRVLFFISDDKRSEPDSVLNNQAEKYVSDTCSLKYKKRLLSGETAKLIFKMALSAGIGLAIGTMFL
ncbi:MAG: hypothetical protein IJO01_07095 [Oscillospiraceae bacterium]|nr:hypothetical protein [Oscillospiraceae bacterium]